MAKDFTTTFLVDQSPKQVFKAVTNVRGWWQGLYEEENATIRVHLHGKCTWIKSFCH